MKKNYSDPLTNLIDELKFRVYLSEQEKVILLILSIYNCRISEVLESNWNLFFPGKLLVIKAKKNSNDIVIRDRDILKMIENLPRRHHELIFYGINYYAIYMRIKKDYSHLFEMFRSKKNRKVTHGFRYLNARLTDDIEATKTILHHKSKKSQRFYKKNAR